MACENFTVSVALNQSTPAVQYYITNVAIPTVCGFGMLGNVLNMIVLTRDKLHRVLTKMEKSAHLGLIALALSDLMFCFTVLLFTTLPLSDKYAESTFTLYFHFIGSPVISIFILTSTWLIVCMAGERYFAVCHPFKARKIISIRKSKLTILLIFALCSLFSIPLFLAEEIVEVSDCNANSTWYRIQQREGYTDSLLGARRLVWSIIADFIPCGSLIFFNVCLIIHIQRAKKLRKTMAAHSVNGTSSHHRKIKQFKSTSSNSNSQYQCRRCRDCKTLLRPPAERHTRSMIEASEKSCQHCEESSTPQRSGSMRNRSHDSALNSVTATLMAIVLLFLILVSPSEILKFAACSNRESCQNDATFLTIRTVTNFMQSINFSVNFVLYCAISKPFRDTLHSVLCCLQSQTENELRTIILKPPRSVSHS